MDAKDVMHEMFDSSTPPINTIDTTRSLRGQKTTTNKKGLPPTVRFAQEQVTTTAIGPCSCDFLSGVTDTKIVGSTANCAPKNALCMFCMGAAYNDYWQPSADSCEPYIGKAKDVCKAVAGAVKGGAKKELETMYNNYGPQFGASAVFCREGGCCAGKPAR
jgi:hypothetical protein